MLSFKIALSSFPLIKTLSFPFFFKFKNPTRTLTVFSISPKLMATSWTCSRCTFINTDSQKPNCQICLSSPISSSLPSSSQEKWSCKACTFLNPYKLSNCEVCGTRNSSFSSILSLDDEELELGSSAVGNVFLPLLQKCNSSNNNNNTKRKIRDEPVEVDVDLGLSRGSKSANKEVVDSGECKPYFCS